MILGILSDTHNNQPAIIAALALMKEHHAARVFHCGDISSSDMLWLFTGWDVHFVFGNSDINRRGLSQAAKDFGFAPILDLQRADIEGKQIASCHGHDKRIIDQLLASRLVDYLFIGHSHRRLLKRVGNTVIINPGALGGRSPHGSSVAIVNTATNDTRFYQIPDGHEVTPLD